MPRPRKPDGREPKSRSRNGCWSCKARKVKCTEERPSCSKCIKGGYQCDYGIRLNWDGRRSKRPQLKVVHLGDGEGEGDGDGDGDGEGTAGLSDAPQHQHRHPPRSQSQHEMQFQLDLPLSLPSASSAASSSAASTATASTHGFHIISFQAPSTSTVPPSTRARKQTKSASKSSPPGTPADQRIDTDVCENENDFAWTWPLSPSTGSGSTGSGSLSAPSPRQAMRGHLPHLQTTLDVRRLSVGSLLSRPFDPNAVTSPSPSQDGHRGHNQYGIDAGFVDLDLHKNDDRNALSGTAGNYKQSKLSCHHRHGKAYEPGGYYSEPVPVHIPHALGTLPSKLLDNPMNMLYFHHFINNTARVLVPHDDPQSNPFRTILPQLALNNDNLMSLLLAYSASHRARVLDQPEPGMRIALWVQDIFPALRESLTDPKQKISNANVATAIMLSSLAIVSPTAFGYAIPWQRHLMLARELIGARPEGLRVDHHSSLEGQVCSFLWSWFAYLDVLGGLSGGPNDVSPAWILDYKVYDPQDDDEIDCIMGFTTRCIYILSQIAELVRECEPRRLLAVAVTATATAAVTATASSRRDPAAWCPGPDIERRVASLEVDVRDSMVQKPRPCAHLLHKGDVTRWDAVEMAATNEAYHWAALVHLHRRVLGKRPAHPDVQGPVQKIIACLDSVSVGGTAENCWLFPLFTAACECSDDALRKKMLDRIRQIEGCGMMQVTRARVLMQKAWGTGKPWEVLLEGEFLG